MPSWNSSGTAFKTTTVARRHTICTIDLLKNSSLKQVLLVLDNHASLGHNYRVRTHVLKILRAARSNSRQNFRVAVFIIDLKIVA